MDHSPVLSRRRLFQAAAAPLAFGAGGRVFAYVATYNRLDGPEGSRGNGQGIHLFLMNPADGTLTPDEVFRDVANPSAVAVHPDGQHLYSANETKDFEGSDSGSVSAFSINRATGRLTLINTVSSRGAGPCHLSVHPSGRYVFVANYHGGTAAVLPITANKGLGAATDVQPGRGPTGALKAASAPPGSFAISGHDRPHSHMILPDPSGKRVLSTDLALDRIFVWDFDEDHGRLVPAPAASVPLPSGDGPRHFAFAPGGRTLYSLQEEGSTLVVFDYDSATGRLTPRQSLSTLPAGFAGTNYTSEVAVSSDGRFVYAANRLHDSIALFSVGAAGKLELKGEEWTRGDYPRSFTIDPSGRFLYCCNQRGDAVTAFTVDKDSGRLAFTGRYTPVGTPSMILFLV